MRGCRAFTLVELLVVMAVIGILVGLLLPAVHAAREAARKTSCKNNLKQIGLGLHNYHLTNQCLPTGCIEWRGYGAPRTHRQYAWSALLLPFLEQQNLHARIDFTVPFDAPSNASIAATRLTIYECPTAKKRYPSRGPSDYGGLLGEKIIDRAIDDGVFLYDTRIAFPDVRDGTSQTLAVSEDVGGPDSEWINGRNVFVQSSGINDPHAWIGDNEIRSQHAGGAMLLYVDARVDFASTNLDPRLLGGLITRAGGEVVAAP